MGAFRFWSAGNEDDPAAAGIQLPDSQDHAPYTPGRRRREHRLLGSAYMQSVAAASSSPANPLDVGNWLDTFRRRVWLALNLVPYAGIAFQTNASWQEHARGDQDYSGDVGAADRFGEGAVANARRRNIGNGGAREGDRDRDGVTRPETLASRPAAYPLAPSRVTDPASWWYIRPWRALCSLEVGYD